MTSLIDMIRIDIEESNVKYSRHALIKMLERDISKQEVTDTIISGNAIEHYQDDYPCPSLLIEGLTNDVTLHVVVAKCEYHSVIITTYRSDN